MKRCTAALLVSLIAPFVFAQSPYLVKDINTTRASGPRSTFPYGFFPYGSRVVFGAQTSGLTTGWKLCATDASRTTAAPLGNIVLTTFQAPLQFGVINGKLIFTGRDTHGSEVWQSDGTNAGTTLLADINPLFGPTGSNSYPHDFINYHGKLFFGAFETINGDELWVTDGTPAGTRFFKDLLPGDGSSSPSGFVIFNDTLYFAADNGLWKSDGTENGTIKVKSAVNVKGLTVVGSKMFFQGHTEDAGSELWVSDGTTDGTHMVADLFPGPHDAMFNAFVAPFGNRIMFVASDGQHSGENDFWISDGTAAGTHVLRNAGGTTINANGELPSVAVIGNTAYFDASSDLTGSELWKTDGTEAGTTLVSDLIPGTDGSRARNLVAAGDHFFFVASTPGKKNSVLWISDGTASGTRIVRNDAGGVSVGSDLTNIDGTIYFSGANLLNGYEPWKSDGTDAGTVMLANLGADAPPSAAPASLTSAGDLAYFEAWDGFDVDSGGSMLRSLWRTDGTPEGTLKLGGTLGASYRAIGRSILFSNYNDYSPIWTSNGTPEGTQHAAELDSRFPSPPKIDFVNGETIFLTSNYTEWATTLAPSAPAVDLGTGAGYNFTDFTGRTMYFVDVFNKGTLLVSSDGTADGTSVVMSHLDRSVSQPVVMGGHLYFTTADRVSKLWKSDGTAEGTVVVKQLADTYALTNFAATGRNVFFTVSDQLWVTDGTDAGTHTLPAMVAGGLTAAGERVLFTLNGSDPGKIWSSDGTAEGTHALTDDTVRLFTNERLAVDGIVYFTGYDELHGAELWMSDGTTEGTKLAADVEPGVNGSGPAHYAAANGRLFFAASTSASGNELWAMPLSSSSRLSINDVRVIESDTNARFTVTLSSIANRPVTVDYATTDDSANAGSDYDAASGTLTFAPGELSKTIDVHIKGDTNPENNESFFITLRNASGASLAKSTGFAIIEDDDQFADLALGLDFVTGGSGTTLVRVTNNGPRTATKIRTQVTQTPFSAYVSAQPCVGTCDGPLELASGASDTAFTTAGYTVSQPQSYFTATVSAHQRDPQSANNSVAWTSSGNLSLDALYLTPNADGHLWFYDYLGTATLNVESSNPAVISVPATINGAPRNFIVHAVAPGSSTIRVFAPGRTIGTIVIDVVAAGTAPRWNGAIDLFGENTVVQFDQQEPIHVSAAGTAPFTGKRATGSVVITSGTHELGRITLDGTKKDWILKAYLPEFGSNVITATYSGDENFLPMTATSQGYADRGHATIAATISDSGTTATIHVRLIGSPMAAPTGKVYVGETTANPNMLNAPLVSLTSTTPGVAEADVTLTGLPSAPHTFRVYYPGDGRHYDGSQQDFRIVDARKHSVRH